MPTATPILTPFIQRNFRGLVLRQTDGPHELRCLKEVETAVAGANLRTPGEVQVAAGNSDASRRGARSRSTARLEEPRGVPGEVERTSPENNLRFKDGGLGRDKQPMLTLALSCVFHRFSICWHTFRIFFSRKLEKIS